MRIYEHGKKCDPPSPSPPSHQQTTILKELMQGFIFESNRGTRANMTGETPLGPQFSFSWSGDKKGKKFRSKSEMTQEKVRLLARELQTRHFSASHESTRRVAAELRAILTSIEAACLAHDTSTVSVCVCVCVCVCV